MTYIPTRRDAIVTRVSEMAFFMLLFYDFLNTILNKDSSIPHTRECYSYVKTDMCISVKVYLHETSNNIGVAVQVCIASRYYYTDVILYILYMYYTS